MACPETEIPTGSPAALEPICSTQKAFFSTLGFPVSTVSSRPREPSWGSTLSQCSKSVHLQSPCVGLALKATSSLATSTLRGLGVPSQGGLPVSCT